MPVGGPKLSLRKTRGARDVGESVFENLCCQLHWAYLASRSADLLGQPAEDLLIVFVAPPWGHALSEGSGLDLRRTQPPVAEVIDVTTDVLGDRKLLFAIQVFQTVEPDSLGAVTARLPWSALKVYDVNAPGQNHGLLLGTWGWAAG